MTRLLSARWNIPGASSTYVVVLSNDEAAKDTRRHVTPSAAISLLERWTTSNPMVLQQITEALGASSAQGLSARGSRENTAQQKNRIAQAIRARKLFVLSPEASQTPAASRTLKNARSAPSQFQIPWTDPVRIEVIQGDSTTTEAVTQFVNLPKDPQWVDDVLVKSISRLGRLVSARIFLSENGTHPATVRLEPDAATRNVTYDRDELRHNPFTTVDDTRNYPATSPSFDVPEGDFTLPVAGGNGYRITATHNGAQAQSQVVKTERLIYCIEMMRRSTTRPINDRIMGRIKDKFQPLGIKLHHLHQPNAIPTFEFGANVPLVADHVGHLDEFGAAVRAGFRQSRLPDRSRYTLPLIYVDYLIQSSGELTVTREVTISPGDAGNVVIPIAQPINIPNSSDTVTLSRDLYFHPDTPLRTHASWLRQATLSLPGAEEPTDIPPNLIQPVRRKDSRGRELPLFNAVQLDLRGLITETVTARIQLRVVTANHMHGGYHPHLGMVLLARKVFLPRIAPATRNGFSGAQSTQSGPPEDQSAYETVSANDMEETLIHEVAHGFGLKNLPHLTRPTHVIEFNGFHCTNGLTAAEVAQVVRARADTNGVFRKIRCIMGPDDTNERRRASRDFCTECSTLLRKADLSVGWNRSLS
jgi:hypothetical protein